MNHAEEALAAREAASREPAGSRNRMTLYLRCWGLIAALLAHPAQASMFKGDALDAIADGIAWVALIVGPIVAIAVFWLIHILPEKIAEKRKHPQKQAIHTLCILSLFFGGLLWPLAFLWAYSKPVLYRMAYGTDAAEPEGHEEAGVEAPSAEPHAARMKVVAERPAEPGSAAGTRETA